MESLRFRTPGVAFSLSQLLGRVFDGPGHELEMQWVRRARLRIDGRPPVGVDRAVAPGALVTLEIAKAELARARSSVAWPIDAPAGASTWCALVPLLPWRRGALAAREGEGEQSRSPSGPRSSREPTSGLSGASGEVGFEILHARAGVAELSLAVDSLDPDAIAGTLAHAGFPLLGDFKRGGILVAGGLRLRRCSPVEQAESPEGWWPDEAVFPGSSGTDGRRAANSAPIFNVSRATARALQRGHPWILKDEEMDDPARFGPGTLVRVQEKGQGPLGLAHIEGTGRVSARMWERGDASHRESPSVEARVARALSLRRKLMSKGAGASQLDGTSYTDTMRLIHGEADGLPGIAVDRLGGMLRVLVAGAACTGWMQRAVEAVARGFAPELGDAPPVIEVLHLRDAPSRQLECVRWRHAMQEVHGSPALDGRGRIRVRERGLSYLVDPGLREPLRPRPGFGLYIDQRENRERLARLARRGGRWLNLFAHTGAFSVALLAAGAEEVVSVDLSGAYLRWLEENLDLNTGCGVDARRHRCVRRDGRRFLSELAAHERFDGIVLDPPTAAAAGRKFWSVQRDLEPLIASALTRLEPGGSLLVCRNERGARVGLEQLLRRAAGSALHLGKIAPALPGNDFPRLKGFPEGNSFSGVIAQRS